MAKRRRRRPAAGPPPVRNPRHEAKQEQAASGKRPPVKGPGAPRPTSFRGVLARALIVAGLFYIYLVYLVREDALRAIGVTALALVVMIPVGLLVDRWRYRTQLRRFERARGGPK